MARTELVPLIEDHIDDIVQAWVKAVRADERIHSDADLSEGGLRDHVPMMLQELCDALREGATPTISNTHEGRVHAYLRFCQGYRARDLACEISLLRMTLTDHVNEYLLNGPYDLDLRSYIEAMRIINLYFDEELRYAFAIYTEQSSGIATSPDPETRRS
jgi:hypothetical protein